MSEFKTFSQKPADVTRRWILIDAKDATLGRISTAIAKYLIGKYKPTYTPHVDGGDYVVVINAKELVVTGAKETDKMYYRHSGFPGGLKEAQLKALRKKAQRASSKKPSKACFQKTNSAQSAWHASASSQVLSTITPLKSQRK